MKKLTNLQIEDIIKNKKINNCTEQEKKQVFAYAFGDKFMASNDKGTIKQYNSK